jgi:hypothetical protein
MKMYATEEERRPLIGTSHSSVSENKRNQPSKVDEHSKTGSYFALTAGFFAITIFIVVWRNIASDAPLPLLQTSGSPVNVLPGDVVIDTITLQFTLRYDEQSRTTTLIDNSPVFCRPSAISSDFACAEGATMTLATGNYELNVEKNGWHYLDVSALDMAELVIVPPKMANGNVDGIASDGSVHRTLSSKSKSKSKGSSKTGDDDDDEKFDSNKEKKTKAKKSSDNEEEQKGEEKGKEREKEKDAKEKEENVKEEKQDKKDKKEKKKSKSSKSDKDKESDKEHTKGDTDSTGSDAPATPAGPEPYTAPIVVADLLSQLEKDSNLDPIRQQYVRSMHAVGVLEGYLTCTEMGYWYENFYDGMFAGGTVNRATMEFLEQNHVWMNDQAALYWKVRVYVWTMCGLCVYVCVFVCWLFVKLLCSFLCCGIL